MCLLGSFRIEDFCISTFPEEEPDVIRHLPEILAEMKNLGLVKALPVLRDNHLEDNHFEDIQDARQEEGGVEERIVYRPVNFEKAKQQLKEKWDMCFDL